MPWPSRHTRAIASPDEPEVVFDDGGSGIYDAACERFVSQECTVECDARHTVWVKRADGKRSLGISPWMVGRRSIDQLLDDVGEKLCR